MKTVGKIIITIALIMFSINPLIGDGPAPPPPDHGTTGNQEGNGAPIGNGLFILLGLGAGYGIKKIRTNRKNKSDIGD
ncbi:MAG: hypothetical protein K9I94_01700 [Bacteroidales bacterium]|nr:hypothetical protein [Bacteroidales bacterium]